MENIRWWGKYNLIYSSLISSLFLKERLHGTNFNKRWYRVNIRKQTHLQLWPIQNLHNFRMTQMRFLTSALKNMIMPSSKPFFSTWRRGFIMVKSKHSSTSDSCWNSMEITRPDSKSWISSNYSRGLWLTAYSKQNPN